MQGVKEMTLIEKAKGGKAKNASTPYKLFFESWVGGTDRAICWTDSYESRSQPPI